ncbi:MAG: hemolysin III [Chlamydiales bacterium]|jgi:hemolysin III
MKSTKELDTTCPISQQTETEEFVNTLTHGAGLLLSIIGLSLLVIFSYMRGDVLHIVSCSIYGTSLILLYGASTWYHACKDLNRKRILRIADHACIYLLIAGSYTPFTFGPLRGAWGWSIFGVVWTFALVGILLKIFYHNRSEKVGTIIYLVMGWMAVVAAFPLVENLSFSGIIWLLSGGLFYSFGTIFYLWEKLPFSHSIWHLFVLGGSLCHYSCILNHVIPPL